MTLRGLFRKIHEVKLVSAVILGGLVFAAWTTLPRVLPGDSAFSRDMVDLGEGMRHAVESPSRPGVSQRMPIDPLVESFLEIHCGREGAARGVLLIAGLSALLTAGLGSLLGPAWFGLLCAAVSGGLWRDFFPPHHDYFTFWMIHTDFTLLAAAVMVWRCKNPTLGRSCALAFALGMALWTRSTLAFFPPLLALYEFASRPAGGPRRPLVLAVIALGPYFLLLPWVKLTWALHGTFVPFEYRTADKIIIPAALGLVAAPGRDWSSLLPPAVALSQSSFLAWALGEVWAHPGRYLLGVLGRVYYLISGNAPLFLLAGLSIWVSRKREEIRQLGLFAAYFIGIISLMAAARTYLLPLWPVLVVLACSLLLPLAAKLSPSLPDEDAPKALLSPIFVAALVCWLAACMAAARYASAAKNTPPSGMQAVEHALKGHPGDPWLLWQHGRARLAEGDPSGAAAELSAASARLPWAEIALERDLALALSGRPHGLLNAFAPEGGKFEEAKWRVFRAVALLRAGRSPEAKTNLFAANNSWLPAWGWPLVAWDFDPGISESLDSDKAERFVNQLVLPTVRILPVEDHRRFLASVAEVFPMPHRWWLKEAERELQSGRRGHARNFLNLAPVAPLEASVRLETARLHRRLGQFRESLDILESVPPHPEGRKNLESEFESLAAIAMELEKLSKGELRERLAVIEKLSSRNPGRPEFLHCRVRLHQALGEHRKALGLLRSAAGKDGGDAEELMGLASAALSAGERPGALAALGRARAKARSRTDLRRLAHLYDEAGEAREALRLFEFLVQGHDNDAVLRKDLAVCAYRAGNLRLAARNLEAALKLDPGLQEASLSLGAVYVAQGRRAEALRVYEAALAAAPGDPAPLRELIEKALKDVRGD